MEALGGAASVIGVVSLAIELCKELRKVHDFWQSVREAPHHIAHISTEINLLITWLAVIANNYQRQELDRTNPNHSAAMDTLKLCLATVQDMNQGVNDLESRLSTSLSSRRWASVKFVFRKDKRETLMQQMERMKSLLIIVQTCYIGEMQEAGFRSLSVTLRPRCSAPQTTGNTRLLNMSATAPTNEKSIIVTQELQPTLRSPVEIAPFEPKASLQASRPSQRSRTRQEESAYNFGFAVLKFVGTEQESVLVEDSGNNRSIKTRRTRYDLRLAQWLLTRGFSWQTSGIYGSWKHSFRAFRYIPRDALIIDFCIEGDVANVQKMFDKGLASPFDRVTMWGYGDWSLLHFSILNCNVRLCKYLIECGLGFGSVSGMSMTPILYMIGLESPSSDPTPHLDTLRVMVNEGQYDPMEEANGTSVMHSFDGPPTAYQWLLHQGEFSIDLEQTAVFRAETIAAALISTRKMNSSGCLKAVLAQGSDLNDPAGSGMWGEGLTLAHRAVCYLTYLADNVDFPKRIQVLWEAGADFHTPKLHNCFGTTLDFLFRIVSLGDGLEARTSYRRYGVEWESVPAPPIKTDEDIIEYDRLDNTSPIHYRPRTAKSLWRTWSRGNDFSVLELTQRYLDAWTEVLLEAGLDTTEYGRREDSLHPEGLFDNEFGQARFKFEYGDHVDGCRIHVTEIWRYGRIRGKATEADTTAKMPCSWDFEDT